MDIVTLLQAALLGVVEGLTEFLPVSSTGHLILLEEMMSFAGPPGKVFEVFIQLGAISAILWLYRQRFIDVLIGLPKKDPLAWRFALNLLVALVPALVLGGLFHDYIKDVLFCSSVVIASMIVGGIAILLVEKYVPLSPRVLNVDDVDKSMAFKIGLCQCLAMIPGVSRSGATIIGAMLLGVERKAAAEFSFFLAVPTMLAASSVDLYKNAHQLHAQDALVLAVGFVSAFIAAVIVVRKMIAFVTRNGFAPFGWYRIVFGILMLMVLYLF